MESKVPKRNLKRPLVYEVGMTVTNRRCGNNSGGARLSRVRRLVTKGMKPALSVAQGSRDVVVAIRSRK